MGQYDNKRVFEKGLQMFISNTVDQKVIAEIFRKTAVAIFDWVDSQGYYENQTYNLLDSIGVGTYKKGVMQQWHTPQARVAKESRIITYKGTVTSVNGFQLLQEAISAGNSSMLADYTLVVYAAVPYAAWVDLSLGNGGNDKRGTGWWREGLIPFVKQTVQQLVTEYTK